MEYAGKTGMGEGSLLQEQGGIVFTHRRRRGARNRQRFQPASDTKLVVVFGPHLVPAVEDFLLVGSHDSGLQEYRIRPGRIEVKVGAENHPSARFQLAAQIGDE